MSESPESARAIREDQTHPTSDSAVCFTAGPSGAPFGAGVIHAYLASDQEPPAVVAGVSLGALNAAAMQRAYADLYEEKEATSNDTSDDSTARRIEAARWAWFRKYINSLADNPLDVVWNAVPNQSDFFADMIPTKDLSIPESWQTEEQASRRKKYLLVHLGRWLANLPISIREIATLLVSYVRVMEQFPLFERVKAAINLIRTGFVIVVKLIINVAFSPHRFPESQFRTKQAPRPNGDAAIPRIPSWLAWANHASFFLALVILILFVILLAFEDFGQPAQSDTGAPAGSNPLIVFGVLLLVALLYFCAYQIFRAISASPFGKRWLLPTVGYFLCFLSWINCVALILFVGYPLVLLAPHNVLQRSADLGLLLLWIPSIAFICIASISLFPFMFLPATLKWALDQGFMHESARPLLGRRLYVFCVAHVVSLLLTALLGLALIHFGRGPLLDNAFYGCLIVFACSWLTIFVLVLMPRFSRSVIRYLLRNIGLLRGVVHDYSLRRTLAELFDPNWGDPASRRGPLLSEQPFPIILVATPLQTIQAKSSPVSGYQLWAKVETPLIDALRTALAVPPFIEPTRLEGAQQVGQWLRDSTAKSWGDDQPLDLVDGALVRRNPLPALFAFLRTDRGKVATERLLAGSKGRKAAIHVIYQSPIKAHHRSSKVENGKESQTIVDVVRQSLILNARRDTRSEVIQTNFIGGLEATIQDLRIQSQESSPVPLFADEIAPDEDIVYKNPLSPTRKEVLRTVASGCRKTLERLYDDRTSGEIPCSSFLKHRLSAERAVPGLPEICGNCTKLLQIFSPTQQSKTSDPIAVYKQSVGPGETLVETLEGLRRDRPRVVLVTSGGVFRGSFHVGMMAALWSSNVVPDLIVGNSVGTLMGGAFGKMMYDKIECQSGGGAPVLVELVQTWLHVDYKIAFTTTLKDAVRELGLRGKAVALSPRKLTKLIHGGSRADSSYAVSGAPSALVDALSDLFMIPHRKTARIAADFVSGHVAAATFRFLRELNRETLSRLRVEQYLIGTSLIEKLAPALLINSSARLDRQPFAPHIGWFGTTTALDTQQPQLLGGFGLHLHSPYNHVEAALASSSFPGAFAPRLESNIFPGVGDHEKYYSDGGMFDNLPFLPALLLLSMAQSTYRQSKESLDALDFLEMRHEKPDLIIVGALDVPPEQGQEWEGPFETIYSISGRAASLKNNVKIRDFEITARMVDEQLGRIINARKRLTLEKSQAKFLDAVVDAAILPIFPTDQDHLNGTFSFCRSTGLRKKTISLSISDGCFQTFYSLSNPPSSDLLKRSLAGLKLERRLPEIQRTKSTENTDDGKCPYFQLAAGNIDCPFWTISSEQTEGGQTHEENNRDHQRVLGEVRNIYHSCRKDPSHKKLILADRGSTQQEAQRAS